MAMHGVGAWPFLFRSTQGMLSRPRDALESRRTTGKVLLRVSPGSL